MLRNLLRKPKEGLQLAGERVQRRRAAATERVQQVRGQVVRRVRKSLTGAEDRRLRDVSRERLRAMRRALEEPPVVRLMQLRVPP